MSKFRSASLAVLVLLCFISQTRGDDAADARQVIASGIKALGGDVKHDQFKAAICRAEGTIYIAGESHSCKVQFVYQPPKQFCLNLVSASFTMATVLNGEQGWTRLNNFVAVMNKEQHDEAREMMYAEQVTSLVPLLKEDSYVLSLLGNAKIERSQTIGVKVRHRGQRDVKLFLDMKTGLLVKMETTIKENGVTVLKELYLENWESFDGVLRPRRVVTNRDRKQFTTLQLTEYKTMERKVGDGAFVRPRR